MSQQHLSNKQVIKNSNEITHRVVVQPNQNHSNISSQERWASAVSDYILRRRQQTLAAYSIDDNDSIRSLDKDQAASETLFKALLIILANQLEEGHTVFTIPVNANSAPIEGNIVGRSVLLYNWQLRILNILVEPLENILVLDDGLLVEGDAASNASALTLMNIWVEQGQQLWPQISQKDNQREMLQQRYRLLNQLLSLFEHINNGVGQTTSDSRSTIEAFIKLLQNNSLFNHYYGSINLKDKNSLSKNNSINQTKSNTLIKFHTSLDNKKNIKTLTFWLHRTWQAEFSLATSIMQLLEYPVIPLDIEPPKTLNLKQLKAIEVANQNSFCIITGGPGTGKTYTVAQLVIALQQARVGDAIRFSTDAASLALAAPTGKAAQRMQESLEAVLSTPTDKDVKLQEAKTIHRLLGIGRDGQPRYHKDNPLGEDVVIVDEASMLGVELANHLVSAIKPGARLILLGDANQLAAVDAGSVLADLCRVPTISNINVELTESRRFDAYSGIGKLATQIKSERYYKNKIADLFKSEDSIEFINIDKLNKDEINNLDINYNNSLSNNKNLKKIAQDYINYLNNLKNYKYHKKKAKSIPTTAFLENINQSFNQFRILTAGHHGIWGDIHLNDYLTRWHKDELKLPLGKSPWFHGRPIMVLQNNYELGLFNGDIGICLQISNNPQDIKVFFDNNTNGVAVDLLNEDLVSTAYAMTIHKSQGSEFEHVAITFDDSNKRLLSKELIYTAVTRAKNKVTIYSTESALTRAIKTPTIRQTGLGLQFQQLI